MKHQKRKKKKLYCDDCDNKFSSLDALTLHTEIKTNNTGRQEILPSLCKEDASMIIVCKEGKFCYSMRSIR